MRYEDLARQADRVERLEGENCFSEYFYLDGELIARACGVVESEALREERLRLERVGEESQDDGGCEPV